MARGRLLAVALAGIALAMLAPAPAWAQECNIANRYTLLADACNQIAGATLLNIGNNGEVGCYRRLAQQSQPDGHEACQDLADNTDLVGGLSAIQTLDENNAIWNHFGSAATWFGLIQPVFGPVGVDNGFEPTERWTNFGGCPQVFQNWPGSEPNDCGGNCCNIHCPERNYENCVHNRGDGTWNDLPCTVNLHIMCEFDLECLDDADGDGLGDTCEIPGCEEDDDLDCGDPNVDGGINFLADPGCQGNGVDTDGDGIDDNCDGCPNNANKEQPGNCGCDSNKETPGDCGCDTPDVDANGNGVSDCLEAPPCTATISCPAAFTVTASAGNCLGSASVTGTVAVDAGAVCNGISVTAGSSTTLSPGTHMLTSSFTTQEGTTGSCATQVTVVDSTAPSLVNVPGDATAGCFEAVPPPAAVSGSDSCPGHVGVSLSEVVSNEACANQRTVTRTWTATDAAGLTTSASQTITVQDTTPPSFAGLPNAAVTVSCVEDVPAPAAVTASDDCAAPVDLQFSETDSFSAGNCPNERTIVRTWTATDCSGNVASFTQTITVHDTTPPSFAGLPNAAVAVTCVEDVPAPAPVTASDNCDAPVDLQFSETDSFVQGNCPNERTIVRTWTATDCSGNVASFVQTITVHDATPPALAGLPEAAVTVECIEDVPAPAPVTATDCDSFDASTGLVFSETDSHVAGQCANDRTITRTWTATDCSGNVASFTQTITVIDTTAPVLTGLPEAAVTVACIADLPPAADVGVSDNCEDCLASPGLTFRERDSYEAQCENERVVTRTWTATDCLGNSASFTQVVTVRDDTAPVLAGLPEASVTVSCIEDVPAVAPVTATDNCADFDASTDLVFNEVDSFAAGGCVNERTITRTWTATDCSGNVASFVQTITVDDNEAPVLAGLPDVTVTVSCIENVPAVAPVTATDNCADFDASTDLVFNEVDSFEAGGCVNERAISRTWTATDCSGNVASFTQIITVDDNEAPVLTGLPDDASFKCEHDVPAPAPVSGTDNCANYDPSTDINFNEVRTDGSCRNRFALTRTWDTADCSGNTDTHTQTISVFDDVAPTQDAVNSQLCVFPRTSKQKNAYMCFGGATSNTAQDQGGLISFTDTCGSLTIDGFTCSSTAPASSSSGRSGNKPCSSSSGSSRRERRRLGGKSKKSSSKAKSSSKSSSGKSSVSGSSGSSFSGSSGGYGFNIFWDKKDKPDCVFYAQHDMVCVRAKVSGAEKKTGRTYTIGFTATDECGNTQAGSRTVWIPRTHKQLVAAGLEDSCHAPTHRMKCGDPTAMFPGAPGAEGLGRPDMLENEDDTAAQAAEIDDSVRASAMATVDADDTEADQSAVVSLAVIGVGLVVAGVVVAVVRRSGAGSASKVTSFTLEPASSSASEDGDAATKSKSGEKNGAAVVAVQAERAAATATGADAASEESTPAPATVAWQ